MPFAFPQTDCCCVDRRCLSVCVAFVLKEKKSSILLLKSLTSYSQMSLISLSPQQHEREKIMPHDDDGEEKPGCVLSECGVSVCLLRMPFLSLSLDGVKMKNVKINGWWMGNDEKAGGSGQWRASLSMVASLDSRLVCYAFGHLKTGGEASTSPSYLPYPAPARGRAGARPDSRTSHSSLCGW